VAAVFKAPPGMPRSVDQNEFWKLAHSYVRLTICRSEPGIKSGSVNPTQSCPIQLHLRTHVSYDVATQCANARPSCALDGFFELAFCMITSRPRVSRSASLLSHNFWVTSHREFLETRLQGDGCGRRLAGRPGSKARNPYLRSFDRFVRLRADFQNAAEL
jgi:hypothetical protein